MSAVERVTYRVPGRQTPAKVLLTDVKESFKEFASIARVLTGVEVDAEGVRKDPDAAALKAAGGDHGTRIHVIDTALVLKRDRLVCDRLTGLYVDPARASQNKGWHWPVDARLVHWFRISTSRRTDWERFRSACYAWMPDSGEHDWISAETIAEYRADGLLCRTCEAAWLKDGGR